MPEEEDYAEGEAPEKARKPVSPKARHDLDVHYQLGGKGREGEPIDIPPPNDEKMVKAALNSAIGDYRKYGIDPGLKSVKIVDRESKDVEVAFATGDSSIQVNSRSLKSSMIRTVFRESRESIKAGDWPAFAFQDEADIMIHEIAHTIGRRFSAADSKAWEHVFKNFWQGEFVPSAYAQENSSELFAESVVAIIKDHPNFKGPVKDKAVELLRKYTAKVTPQDDILKPKPAPPKAVKPKPAEPKPVKPLGPAGKPVGEALEPKLKTPRVERAVKDALATIDKVHGDGNLPKIPVQEIKKGNNGGQMNVVKGRPTGIDIHRAVETPRLTTAHEVGHFLDWSGIEAKQRGSLGQIDYRKDPRFNGFLQAVDKSDAVQSLKDVRYKNTVTVVQGKLTSQCKVDKKYVDYLLQDHEVWARAYSQYVATRSEDKEMMAELDHMLRFGEAETYKAQWGHDDFKPIAAEIDKLFKGLGWLK